MSFTRLTEILDHQLATYPQPDCLVSKVDGKWIPYSTQQVVDQANAFSRAFIKYGIQPGDKVGLICGNRPEWNFIDMGILQVQAINVPIYPTISPREYEYIFNDAKIKVAFVENADLFKKVNKVKQEIGSLQDIYTIEKVEGAKHISEFLELGKDVDQAEVQAKKDAIDPGDVATFIYTSGTTGNPKGVMLSHNNLVSNVKAVTQILTPLDDNAIVLSFLPLCHVFERVVIYNYYAVGASVYYAESMEKIADNLKEVKPHFFTSVPRLLEKVYDKIVAKGLDLEGFKRKLFFWALDLGLKYDVRGNNSMWYNMKLFVARKLIFSKWQEALGGNLIGIVTGAAALQSRLERVFNAAGIAVRQGYGQTESSPVITIGHFEEGSYELGTVGQVLPGVEVKIHETSGEILCKGPNVMVGYYNLPDKTAETVVDGWLHTGDVGEFVDGKYLKITDRVKELFKTSGGKYIAPQALENKMKESPLIEQMAVVGENEKFVGALVIPNEENLRDWCNRNGVEFTEMFEIVNNKTVIKAYEAEINEMNKDFGKWEQIKRFKLLPNQWDVSTDELTPTLKLKRRVINEKYAQEIADLFNV